MRRCCKRRPAGDRLRCDDAASGVLLGTAGDVTVPHGERNFHAVFIPPEGGLPRLAASDPT